MRLRPRQRNFSTVALYTGTGIQKPDYLAAIDADPESRTYSQVIHRLEMPGIGDELHHTGWNACSSCHDDASMSRRYLLLPGVRSNNIYVVDTATDPKAPSLHRSLTAMKSKANLRPTHRPLSRFRDHYLVPRRCQGRSTSGYLRVNEDFEIVGRWENSMGDIPYGYDFWYQPRHNVMTAQVGGPKHVSARIRLEEVDLVRAAPTCGTSKA